MQSYWFLIILSLCVSALLKSLLHLIFSPNHKEKLPPPPPGPTNFPVVGNLLWLGNFSLMESIIRDTKTKYGPIFSLRLTTRPTIFVASHSLAHRALVQHGAVFSDRPEDFPTAKIFNSNHHNISSAAYGPTWRLLRRNLISEVLHPSRLNSYSRARHWVLSILIQRLQSHAGDCNSQVHVVDHFRYAMFCLLTLMCFGEKLQEVQIQEIEIVMRKELLAFGRFDMLLNFFPKFLFRRRWKELLQLRLDQENLLLPLIRARIEAKRQGNQQDQVVAYVDTLVGLQLPDEKRELKDGEIVSLCSEFLNGGTDTTSTALQWIMANLVKHPAIQEKLYEEIVAAVGAPPPPLSKEDVVEMEVNLKEEDLQKIPYLKAVVLEGLRRHPPGHFVLPHSVTEDVILGGYKVPKKAVVNFMVADMGWDPEVWENPMEFRPERFLEGTVAASAGVEGNEIQMYEITGSKEIKMMPFGAGRRVCPGSALAVLHLEYFVANLIWLFEWKPVDGDDVDLSEKEEFTVVMKNPLRASISPRVQSR